jgi:hypothetical protein
MALRGRIIAAVIVLIILGIIVVGVMRYEKTTPTLPMGPSPGPSPSGGEEEEEEEEPGPCDEYDDDTPASQVSVACLRKTLTDLGCSANASLYTSIDDDYAGWFKTDGDEGAGTFLGIRTSIEDYVNSDDDAKREECLGST